ncbi:MAG TPA: hypothetical protein PLN52_17765, partial [Opitutaceae bacterium]|nr:hypothetical protein [Opitutaceae bacterium]
MPKLLRSHLFFVGNGLSVGFLFRKVRDRFFPYENAFSVSTFALSFGEWSLVYHDGRIDTVGPVAVETNGGTWPTSHVQGVAVDVQGGYIYYSFTTLLAKFDLKGNLVGTIGGFTGHLGDLDFNPSDGRVYGSLEYKADQAFYIAVIDVSRLDR